MMFGWRAPAERRTAIQHSSRSIASGIRERIRNYSRGSPKAAIARCRGCGFKLGQIRTLPDVGTVAALAFGWAPFEIGHPTTKEVVMVLTAAQISPLVALIAGILILIVPQLLSYIVAIYLIVVGLVGLNDIYHFVT
jgi:Protein of unknown function (DUF3096)